MIWDGYLGWVGTVKIEFAGVCQHSDYSRFCGICRLPGMETDSGAYRLDHTEEFDTFDKRCLGID